MSTFSKRLKEARKAEGLSQEQLGIDAGLEPASASARMNQYEKDKHVPNPEIVRQIAGVLRLPTSYFYSEDDDEARLLVAFYRMSAEQRATVLRGVLGE